MTVMNSRSTSALRAPRVFQIGGMYTISYHDGRSADWGVLALRGARIALEEINESGFLGPDRIEMKPENIVDYHCWPEGAERIAEELLKRDILALTGVDCSEPAVRISEVAAKFKKPAVSYGANAAVLSSPEEFPYFVRVVTPSATYERYLVDTAAHFGLGPIVLFHTTEAWGIGAREVILSAAESAGLAIAAVHGYPRDTPVEDVERLLAEAEALGIQDIFIAMPTPDTVTVFRAVARRGLNRPGVSIFASEMVSADESAEAVSGALGYFAPITKLRPSSKLESFRARLEKKLARSVDPDAKAFNYAVLSYDHILAVGHALKCAGEAGEEEIGGEVLMRYLRRVDFEGASGRVNVSPGTNDRALTAVEIMNCHGFKEDGKTVDFAPVGSVDPLTGRLTQDESRILWPGGTATPPRAR